MSATVCLNDGDTHNSPVEQIETKHPLIVEELSLRESSGGAGKYRGGLGIARTVRARASLTLNTTIERMHCRPWGLDGGGDGAGNEVWLKLDGREVRDLPNAKVLVQRLQAGDTFTLCSGGGGGFGDPRQRDPQAVAYDVAEGYVTAWEARTLYRVVLTADGGVDVAATQALRGRP